MIFYIIGGVVVGGLFLSVITLAANNRKLKKISNEKLICNSTLEHERELLIKSNTEQIEKANELRHEIDALSEEKNMIAKIVDDQKETLYEDLQRNKEEAEEEYLNTIADLSDIFSNRMASFKKACEETQKQFKKFAEQVEIAAKIQLEEDKVAEQIAFHMFQFSQEEQTDINRLREFSATLNNKEILNKVVWKSYFEKQINNLINRLMGSETVCGIYMIKDTITNKVYIGQSVDIAARFKQHVKKGLGAETTSMNKLYSAMRTNGVENFAFYIVQACPREELSNNEKIWIEFYQSNLYGLNSTAGG